MEPIVYNEQSSLQCIFEGIEDIVIHIIFCFMFKRRNSNWTYSLEILQQQKRDYLGIFIQW